MLALTTYYDDVICSHSDWTLTCLATHHDDKSYLITGSADDQVCVWSATTATVTSLIEFIFRLEKKDNTKVNTFSKNK